MKEFKYTLMPGSVEIANMIIDPGQTWDNLVECDYNRLAITLSKNMLIKSEINLNPIYIHGKIGSGKTHILNSIGNQIINDFPEKIVYFLSSFDFYSKIKKYGGLEVYNSLIHVDILLINGLDYLQGLDEAQQILSDIILYLKATKKLIVITSHNTQSDLILKDYLISKINSGISVEIMDPTMEDKIDIIKSKLNRVLKYDFYEYISKNTSSNLNELTGVANAINISMNGSSNIAIHEIDNILSKISSYKKEMTIKYILRVVLNYFNLTYEQLIEKTRKREIVWARQIAMYFSRRLTKESLATIGYNIGGKDHATVLHAFKTVNNLCDTDKRFKDQVDEIESKLR